MSEDETIATSTTGVMTPESTITNCSAIHDFQEMTTILVEVVEAGCTSGMEHHIKMPRDMAFKKVATLLSNKFKSAKDAQLCLVVSQESGPPERRYIFDSDTPDSLGLKDRTRLRFEHSRGVESIDMSDM